MFTVEQISKLIIDDIDGDWFDDYWFEFFKVEGENWYNTVESPEGTTLYEGHWPNSESENRYSAIKHVLEVTGLLKEESK